MGQLYAGREILFNCKIFVLEPIWSSLWEGRRVRVLSGGMSSKEMELERNWNSHLSLGSSSLALNIIFRITLISSIPVVSHLCLVVSSQSCQFNDSNIPGRMEIQNNCRWTKCGAENLNPISCLECQRKNKFRAIQT